MSVGTEPTSLPEYHQAQLSTVHYQIYSYCRFQGPITDYVAFSRPILLPMTSMMRGTDPIGLPICHLAE